MSSTTGRSPFLSRAAATAARAKGRMVSGPSGAARAGRLAARAVLRDAFFLGFAGGRRWLLVRRALAPPVLTLTIQDPYHSAREAGGVVERPELLVGVASAASGAASARAVAVGSAG